MNKLLNCFMTTLLAGLSTSLGIIPCLFKSQKEKIISPSLMFSSGVMITLSIFSLIPESFKLLTQTFNKNQAILVTLFLFSAGIFIFKIINKNSKTNNKSPLYNLGILSLFTIIIHNIPEGMATFISYTSNPTLGIKLAIAIALHNIPEGIAIAIPIYYATKNLKKASIYTIISGLSEFIGALITFLFLKDYITPLLQSITLAITAGIMISISITEYIPNSKKYNSKNNVYFFIGSIIMIITEILT